jgi:sec-independent protein translocase protein TatB
MEFLGVGPLELVFIIIFALILLGPRDMVKAGRTLGKWLRQIVTSPAWRTVQQASTEIRYLPNRLIREAGMEDLSQELKDSLPNAETLRKETGLDELVEWKRAINEPANPDVLIGTPTALPADPAPTADSAAWASDWTDRPSQDPAPTGPPENTIHPTSWLDDWTNPTLSNNHPSAPSSAPN